MGGGGHLSPPRRPDLGPLAEIDYPQAPGVAAVPLGDGTWLTHDGETVQRWTTP
ncbi:hypothetical protein ACF064_04810 [Streptomyces sp. NPDC015492]|uniref:hypothetical protein n=1 Tax=Streptomyces sp. NPDC015492 TaxID=3364958 RepID=UPI0036FB7A67